MSRRSTISAIAFFALAAALLSGCSLRGLIPEGQYVLHRNVVETDHSVARNERITREEITKYIKQRPAMDLWGVREWLYMKADTNTPNSIMEVGYVVRANAVLSPLAERYVAEIRRYLGIEE